MPETVQAILWVALGSALGGTGRHLLAAFVARRTGETFPWGTLAVNVSGAFALGLLSATVLAGAAGRGAGWHFLVTGVLGSYTTVSSFSLQTLLLLRAGEPGRALGNVGGSLAACLPAAAAGLWLGGALSGSAS